MLNLLKPIHHLKFIKSLKIKDKDINKYQCIDCNKFYYTDKEGNQISFGDKDEVE